MFISSPLVFSEDLSACVPWPGAIHLSTEKLSKRYSKQTFDVKMFAQALPYNVMCLMSRVLIVIFHLKISIQLLQLILEFCYVRVRLS
jgi:hypothetical protein